MTQLSFMRNALRVAAACLLTTGALAQTGAAPPARGAGKAVAPALAPELEPRAVELLRAMSARLAAAQSMSFSATITYEHPSRIGPALAYTTLSDVTMQRPDKLRVITVGDGPASEFYYNGKTMTAFAPAENLVAVAPAPPTLEATLKLAYDSAAIFFPFTDLMATDPYASIANDLTVAFVIGQSKAIGGTTTDVVGIASESLFMQIWIGSQDKLPRMMRAVFRGDPLRLRHQMELSNWKLDPSVAAQAFASADAANAKPIAFAAPQPPMAAAKKKPASAARAPKTP